MEWNGPNETPGHGPRSLKEYLVQWDATGIQNYEVCTWDGRRFLDRYGANQGMLVRWALIR